ncbi:MAG: hypothetical protein ACI9WU_002934 [Myxococcota bacterium]|jgi:hypothetical protein
MPCFASPPSHSCPCGYCRRCAWPLRPIPAAPMPPYAPTRAAADRTESSASRGTWLIVVPPSTAPGWGTALRLRGAASPAWTIAKPRTYAGPLAHAPSATGAALDRRGALPTAGRSVFTPGSARRATGSVSRSEHPVAGPSRARPKERALRICMGAAPPPPMPTARRRLRVGAKDAVRSARDAACSPLEPIARECAPWTAAALRWPGCVAPPPSSTALPPWRAGLPDAARWRPGNVRSASRPTVLCTAPPRDAARLSRAPGPSSQPSAASPQMRVSAGSHARAVWRPVVVWSERGAGWSRTRTAGRWRLVPSGGGVARSSSAAGRRSALTACPQPNARRPDSARRCWVCASPRPMPIVRPRSCAGSKASALKQEVHASEVDRA